VQELSAAMSERSKILFVVEGRKRERQLVERLAEVFGFSAELYTVNGNIYSLYQAVKKDPYAEIVQVLLGMDNSESDKTILANKFTDIFLVFDCDAQHTMNRDEVSSMSPKEIAQRNMMLIGEMAERFDESTDPLRGKLLVNYPMVESFRDCDDFFDVSYENAEVAIDDLTTYKSRVGGRKLARFHLKDYTEGNFRDLILMNLCKLNKIMRERFAPCGYEEFLSLDDQVQIAEAESTLVAERSVLSVLNTLLFFPLEYFGEVGGFYSKLQTAKFGAKKGKCD